MASETLEVTAPTAPADTATPAAPPAEQTPEEIEAQLRATQQALAGKLGVLEEQTLGSIRETVGAVNDAVSSVQSVVADPLGAVQSAVVNPIQDVTNEVTHTVGDFVRRFDPSETVRERPLECFGAAVAGGVVAGLLLFGRPSAGGGRSGLFASLGTTLSTEVAKLGRELIGTLSRAMVERAKAAIAAHPNSNGTVSGRAGYSI